MKRLILCALAAGCATTRPIAHHTAALTAPSVAPVKESINRAGEASRETSRHLDVIQRGTNRAESKATRILRYFP